LLIEQISQLRMKILLAILCVVIVGAVASVLFRSGKTVYWNPIDSRGYRAEWRDYRSENPRSETQTRTILDHVRLLSEQSAFDRDLGIQPLAHFCKTIEAAVHEIVDVGTTSYDLLIEVSVTAERHQSFRMTTQGEAPQDELQRIYDALIKLPAVNSRGADLKFQMYFKAGGGVR
jgi:hypothetical protein